MEDDMTDDMTGDDSAGDGMRGDDMAEWVTPLVAGAEYAAAGMRDDEEAGQREPDGEPDMGDSEDSKASVFKSYSRTLTIIYLAFGPTGGDIHAAQGGA